MTKIGTFYEKDEMKTFDVEEGNITVTKGINVINGQIVLVANFENEVNEENFLMIGTKERSLKLASGIATHINMYEPEIDGSLPKENTNNGDYTPRFVGAAKLTSGEHLLPLDPNNSEIKAGDKLEVKDPKTGLDKSVATTNTATALDDVGAGVGGYILVDVNDGGIKVKSEG